MMRFRLSVVCTMILCVAPGSAQNSADWTEPFPAHTVVGNVHYVGSRGLASYLITTAEGHILINSSLESSVPLIQRSVEQLGFRFADIRILLISHAHWDHCAGSAEVKKLTGAKYMVMEGDVAEVEAGGRGNFHYANLQGPNPSTQRPQRSGRRTRRILRSSTHNSASVTSGSVSVRSVTKDSIGCGCAALG